MYKKTKPSLPSEDCLTLSWLWENVPFRYWISILAFIVGTFIAGIYLGQIGWVKDLLRINPQVKVIHEATQAEVKQESEGSQNQNIVQKSEGDKSQNIVGDTVNVQIGDEKPEK